MDEFGIWESTSKQGYSAIIRPVLSVIQTSFDRGYNASVYPDLDPAAPPNKKPTYLTFEFEDTVRKVDPTVANPEGNVRIHGDNGNMFKPFTAADSVPRTYHNQEHREINGVLNNVCDVPDQRGSPYKYSKEMVFPYSIT